MKTKKLVWAVVIAALLVTVLLISVKAYYVTIALVVGLVIMMHREIWSLIKRRKLPPVDERVRENTSKAIRNGFIFFAAATAFMMLPFGEIVTDRLDTVQVLGALFLAAGLVYLLSYLYYDRAEPKISEKQLKLLKVFLLISALSVGAFIIFVFLHNALCAVFGFEEPVFFVLAVIVSPLAFAVGLLGSLVVVITALAGKPS